MKNDEKVYVLLGWEGHNGMTTKKVIETMKFEGDKIVFGVPMFEGREKGKKGSGQRRNTQLKKRVVFEYTDDAVMTVEYQKDEERIVFDHLEPEQSNLKGIYEFYGPTLSYDAYYWMDSGIWEFKKDIEVKNEQGDRKPYNDPGE